MIPPTKVLPTSSKTIRRAINLGKLPIIFLEVILNVKYAKPHSNNKITTAYVIAVPFIIILTSYILDDFD